MHHARNHTADQARASSDRNGLHVCETQASLVQSLLRDSVEHFRMGARRHLRHHPTKGRVDLRLLLDDRRQDLPILRHERCARVVTAAFYPKHDFLRRCLHFAPVPRLDQAIVLVRIGPKVNRAQAVLLLTRPEPASRRIRDAVMERLGYPVTTVISPAFEIAYLEPALPEPPGTLIFTSEHGVRSVGARGRHLRAYCVGPRTVEVAHSFGYDTIEGPGDAAGLAKMLRRMAPEGRLVHIVGEHQTGDLAGSLAEVGLNASSQTAYTQNAIPLSEAAQSALAAQEPVVLPLFSPRTAKLVGERVPDVHGPLHIIALSPAIASAWAGPQPRSLVTTTRPDSHEMVTRLSDKIDSLSSA